MSLHEQARVLYVEDDQDTAELCSIVLSGFGYTVDVAETGAAAREKLKNTSYSAVLVDYQLPDIDGLELARAILADTPETPIIFVTGGGNENVAAEALALGAARYVIKNSVETYTVTLPNILENVIEQSRAKQQIAQLQNDLLESRERHARAIAGSNDGLWEWNIQTDEDYMSPRWKAILGYNEDELEPTRETFVELLHPDDQERVSAHLKSHLESQTKYDIEFRLRQKIGHYVWVRSRAQVFRDDANLPTYLSGSLTDISEVKELELAARQSEDRYRAVFEHAKDGIVIREAGNRSIVDINDVFARRLGYTKDELIGQQVQGFSSPHGNETVDRPWDEIEPEGAQSVERIHYAKDGTAIPVEITGNQFEFAGGEYIVSFVRDISARVEAINALAVSEKRFRDFAEADSDRFWETDESHRYTFMSASSGAMKRPSDQLIGGRPWGVPSHQHSVEDDRAIRQAFESQVAFRNLRYVGTTPDGDNQHLYLSAVPYFDDDGEFAGFRGSTTDETQEVLARQQATKAEKLFLDAIEYLTDSVSIYDADRRLVACNSQARRDFAEMEHLLAPGTSIEEILEGYSKYIIVQEPGEDPSEMRGATDRAFESGFSNSVVRYRDGRWMSINRYRTIDGGLFIYRTDITAQKLAEQELFESQNKMTELLARTSEGYWDIDTEAVTRDVNSAVCSILDRPREQIIGRSIFEFVDETSAQVLKEQLEQRAQGMTGPYEIDLSRPDGKNTTCLINATPIYDRDGTRTGSVGLLTDISAIKLTLSELEQAKFVAETANRAKSRFLASASHDLRQPLQSAALYVDLLKSLKDGPQRNEVVDKSLSSIAAATGILNALLDISKLDADLVEPKIVDVSLREIFEQLEDFDPLCSSRGLSYRRVMSNAVVRTDRFLIETILRNLVSNAVKYTATGRVLLGCRNVGEKIRIEIWDTGLGIPEDRLKSIFEEFYQIGNQERDREKGLGLGLSIVERTAKLLGHQIDVRSEIGRGSVFSIEVPRSDAEATLVESKLNLDPPRNFTGTAVIIDDEASVLDSLQLCVSSIGLDVTACNYAGPECPDFVALLQQCRKTPPDIILCDYRLPGKFQGADIVDQVRGLADSDIPAVLITGDISGEVLREFQHRKIVVLHKPINSNELKAAISGVLNEDRLRR